MVENNFFYLAIIFILLVTAFFSFLKGFSKDFSSTLCWISAILISHFFGSNFSIFLKPFIPNEHLSKVVAHSLLFILVLIAISIITSKLVRPILDRIPDPINQSLGFIFGLSKCYIILSFLFAITVVIYSSNIFFNKNKESGIKGRHGPNWLQTSKSYPVLEYGASKLESIAANFIPQIMKDENVDITEIIKDKEFEKVKKEAIDSGMDADELGGYGNTDIRKMKKIINIISNIKE